jgi:hypothetical protein
MAPPPMPTTEQIDAPNSAPATSVGLLERLTAGSLITVVHEAGLAWRASSDMNDKIGDDAGVNAVLLVLEDSNKPTEGIQMVKVRDAWRSNRVGWLPVAAEGAPALIRMLTAEETRNQPSPLPENPPETPPPSAAPPPALLQVPSPSASLQNTWTSAVNKKASFETGPIPTTFSTGPISKKSDPAQNSKSPRHQPRRSVFTVAPLALKSPTDTNSNEQQPDSPHHTKVTGTTDEALEKEIDAQPQLKMRALFHKVQRLQEVFCVERDSSMVKSIGTIDVETFEHLCKNELHTRFGRTETNRLFRHLLGKRGTENIKGLKVSGLALVEYFIQGIRIGKGKPLDVFKKRSSLHKHIANVLSRLNAYANRAVKYESQTSSTTILFAKQVNVSLKHTDGTENESASFFLMVVPQIGVQLFSSEINYEAWSQGDHNHAPIVYPEASIEETKRYCKNEDSLKVIHVDTYGSVRKTHTEKLLMKYFGPKEETEKGSQEQNENRSVVPAFEL